MLSPTSRAHRRSPRGLTLVEVLVAVTLIFALVAILLPAVQGAREAARRAHCLNNIRQIGLAILSYHESANALPMGRFKMYDPRYTGSNWPCSSPSVDKSLLVQVLPYLEQVPLYAGINQSLAMFGPENTTTWSRPVATFACPSDYAAGQRHTLNPAELPTYHIPDLGEGPYVMVFTSYAGCFGSLPTSALPLESTNCVVASQQFTQNNGCFNDLQRLNLASIGDGLSNTLFAAEKVNNLGEFDRYGWWVSGNLGDTLFSTFYPPNLKPQGENSSPHPWAASSFHSSGFNALMADGSARFISNSINTWSFDKTSNRPVGSILTSNGWYDGLPRAGIWQALATRLGNEIIAADEL